MDRQELAKKIAMYSKELDAKKATLDELKAQFRLEVGPNATIELNDGTKVSTSSGLEKEVNTDYIKNDKELSEYRKMLVDCEVSKIETSFYGKVGDWGGHAKKDAKVYKYKDVTIKVSVD